MALAVAFGLGSAISERVLGRFCRVKTRTFRLQNQIKVLGNLPSVVSEIRYSLPYSFFVYCCEKIVVVHYKLISFTEMWALLELPYATEMDELQLKDNSYSIKKEHCQDFWNLSVPSGQHYIPGADPCILCLCENGKKFYCQAVRCAASEVYKTFYKLIQQSCHHLPTSLRVHTNVARAVRNNSMIKLLNTIIDTQVNFSSFDSWSYKHVMQS